ncbi:WD40 repeat-like protein [Rhizophagus irregularis]|uniref:WD40 repeat-like protein n=1 Tax=Rhizophagus irregularis TaxID=588596 RepID=A0A2I1FUU9_9GLOM|nr:WD40 repeat-like protein [Rhizophagus irregularis]
MLSEVVLCSSSTDSFVNVLDFRTALIPYSGQCNRISLIISAQVDKPLLHVYSFQKDQVHLKIICPEKIVALAVSNRGVFCAGGTDNGKIYIWEISTGILCKVFDAHYKRISVIKFSNDDSVLISGSEDAGVNVWLLTNLLDDSVDESPSPYYTWSEHSLPITDIWCGIGSFNTTRVLTSSLDHTCKLWDLATGCLLTTFIFPAAITCLIADPAERMFFGGGNDNLIYQIYLYTKQENRGYSMTNSREEVIAVGGTASIVDVCEIASSKDNRKGNLFKGHSSSVTSLALSYDATLLLSGSQDGTLIIWDIMSKQMIKNFSHYKGPIVNLFTFIKPPDLGLSTNNLSNKITIQPIQLFQRNTTQNSEQKDNFENVNIILNDNTKEMELFEYNFTGQAITSLELYDLHKAKQTLLQLQSDNNASTFQTQISSLQSELLRVHNQYQCIKGLNDELYQELLTDFIAKRRENKNYKRKGVYKKLFRKFYINYLKSILQANC